MVEIYRNPQLVGRVLTFDRGVWEDARGELIKWIIEKPPGEVGLKIKTIVSLFAGNTSTIPDGYNKTSDGTDIEIDAGQEENKLTHKVGVEWQPDGKGYVKQYIWESNTRFSQDFTESSTFNQFWNDIVTEPTNCALLKTSPEDQIVVLNYPANATLEFPKYPLSEADFAGSIGKVDLKDGFVTVTVGSPNPDPKLVNVKEVEVEVLVKDLIDYDYFGRLIWPATEAIKWAAILQAGWHRFDKNPGGVGNIFFVQFQVHHFYSSSIYACQ